MILEYMYVLVIAVINYAGFHNHSWFLAIVGILFCMAQLKLFISGIY